MVGTRDGSGTEGQLTKAFGVLDARPAALLGRSTADRLAGPTALAGELAAVALDGRRLRLDGVADVNPVVGVERPREQHGGHLVWRSRGREVMREGGGRGHRIEQGQAGDPVVTMVEVVLPEEDGGGIVSADHVGT